MRKQLFFAIAHRIKEQVPGIKFIDLWNEHMAEITQATAWPVPSVFVEFEQYNVKQCANHICMADVPVRLHIITRTKNYTGGIDDKRIEDALDYFDLIDQVHAAMATLSGENFSTFMLTVSATNHNHAELIESVERYVTRTQFIAGGRKAQATPLSSISIGGK
jgi:hypothetical protein|nr:MAG TPA: hypothetical protein [Caudoviricetes sp.]